jgi:hypothetical protein
VKRCDVYLGFAAASASPAVCCLSAASLQACCMNIASTHIVSILEIPQLGLCGQWQLAARSQNESVYLMHPCTWEFPSAMGIYDNVGPPALRSAGLRV